MWICLSDSFLSIVDTGDASGRSLLVRARRAGDIERVFPGAEVIEGAGTDYAFRARIAREWVAARLSEEVKSLNYPNFKASVRAPDLKAAYGRVWAVMAGVQHAGDQGE